MRRILAGLLLLCGIVAGCGGSQSGPAAAGGDTVALKYAQRLTIVRHEGYTQVDIVDPWKERRILHTYFLVPKGAAHDALASRLGDRPEAAAVEAKSVVRTPVSRSIVFTTVHAALLMELGAAQAISGVCDLKYMNLPWIHRQVKAGRIADCGNGMNADVERVIATRPDALLISPFENSGGYGKLDGIGIPIIETADYMETSALGRAEWMKFYGLLYGRGAEADRLFARVDSNYQALARRAAAWHQRPSVVTELKTGGVWYVPGGQSVVSTMIADAGGRYVFASDKKQGSLGLSFEKVLDVGGQADVWLYKYDTHPATRAELAASHAGYKEMKAWKTGRVYGCNTLATTYYEEASFHPDRVLRDFIIILHPGLHLGALRYYHRIP